MALQVVPFGQTPPQMGYPQMGGGMQGGMGMPQTGYTQQQDPYSAYLKKVFDANKQNPQFQQTILNEFLSRQDPRQQMQDQMAWGGCMSDQNAQSQTLLLQQQQAEEQKRTNDLSMAKFLLESGDPQSLTLANSILSGYFGATPGAEEVFSNEPSSYEDAYRKALQAQLTGVDVNAMDPEEYRFQQYLLNAPDEAISGYNQPMSLWQKGEALAQADPWTRLLSVINPFGDAGEQEDYRRKRAGYTF